MEYPILMLSDEDGNLVNSNPAGPDVKETVPSEAAQFFSSYGLIHFDLDPQNGKQAEDAIFLVSSS